MSTSEQIQCSHSTTGANNRRACVVVASTRAARGEYSDETGPVLVEWLRKRGFTTPEPIVVADCDVNETIAELAKQPLRVLITTGGTGLTPDDLTIEAVKPHLTRELPGVVAAFFARGLTASPYAALSRAVAGTIGECFVMTLPGSRGGVNDGIAVLDPLLDHISNLLENNRGC